ncbi:VasL domain-containing protein [Rahnella sp. PCH160]|uniref:VasL domain-containing protein n=1 Tax=Rahnella sp. PCH160 TaxID=3447928 RepID=UPI0039FC1202
MQQQIVRVNDTPQGGAALWLASPELKDYPQRLNRLLNASPLQPLETGGHMAKMAAAVWPENEQQQQATARWNAAITLRADNSPTLRGYLQVQQDLHAFAALLLQREKSKEGVTLSYLKTVAYQAETLLNKETPVEALLTQLEDAKKKNQNTQTLEKQIDERLDALSSRLLLIKSTGQPGITPWHILFT